MLRDIYDYDELENMPLSDLMGLIRFFTPKIKELREARASKELASALGQS